MTSRSNSSGAAASASTPIMEETEWPTKMPSVTPSSRQISTTSSAYPCSDACRCTSYAAGSASPAPA